MLREEVFKSSISVFYLFVYRRARVSAGSSPKPQTSHIFYVSAPYDEENGVTEYIYVLLRRVIFIHFVAGTPVT